MDSQGFYINIGLCLVWALPIVISLILILRNKALTRRSKIVWILCCIASSWVGLLTYIAVTWTIKDYLTEKTSEK